MDLRKEYRRMYEAYTTDEKRRYWIQLSHGSRAEYVEIESHLQGLAVSKQAIAWRALWRPEGKK